MTLPGLGLVYANEWIDPMLPFFTWGELTKNFDPERIPDSKDLVENAKRLAKVMGEIRKRHGCIWVVTSGYRSKRVNDRIGGAKKSLHMRFRAIDVRPTNGDYEGIVKIARATPGLGGIGLAHRSGKNFVHLDLGFDEKDLTPTKREFRY